MADETGNTYKPPETAVVVANGKTKDSFRNLILFLIALWFLAFIFTFKSIFFALGAILLVVYAIRYWYRSAPETMIFVRTGSQGIRLGRFVAFGPKVGRAMFVLPYFHQTVEVQTQKYEITIEFGNELKDRDPNKTYLPSYQARDSLISGKVQAYISVHPDPEHEYENVLLAARSVGEIMNKPKSEEEEKREIDLFFEEMLQGAVKAALDISTLLENVHNPEEMQRRIKNFLVQSCATIGFFVDSINLVRLQQTRLDALGLQKEGEDQDIYSALTRQKITEISSEANVKRYAALKKAKTKEATTNARIAIAQAVRARREQDTAREQAAIQVARDIKAAEGTKQTTILVAEGSAETRRRLQTAEADMEAYRRITLSGTEKEVLERIANAYDFLKEKHIGLSDIDIAGILKDRLLSEITSMNPEGMTLRASLELANMEVRKTEAISAAIKDAKNLHMIGGSADMVSSFTKIVTTGEGIQAALGKLPVLQGLLKSFASLVDQREQEIVTPPPPISDGQLSGEENK